MSYDSETVEDTKKGLLTEVTDESCTVEFIEIVPLDTASDDHHTLGFIDPVVEVRREDLLDVKQEPADEYDIECLNHSMKQEPVDEHEIEAPYFSIQSEVCSSLETAASGINIPVELIGCNIQPVVVLETLNLSRQTSESLRILNEHNYHINTDTINFSSDVDEKPNEDIQRSRTDNSSRLIQTSDNRTQSVYLSDHVRVDTSNQLDTDNYCKQSYSAGHTEMQVETAGHRFTCTICSKSFKFMSLLNRHVLTHKLDQPRSCAVCEKTFTSSLLLKQHMLVHKVERPFSCEVCDKSFRKLSHLTDHMRTHNGERPFSCEVCDTKFKRTSHLRVHMRTHSGLGLFSCNVCDKKFTQACALRTHMRIHTGERPFCCNVCHKKFNQSSILGAHVCLHSDERPFACEVCDKKFRQICQLKNHTRVHTGEILAVKL